MMSFDLQKKLKAQLEQQEHEWGYIAPERWQAVEAYVGQSALDVGCATGVYVKRLQQNSPSAYGTDLLVYPEWNLLNGRVFVSNADMLPLPSNSFDTILSFETLEHVVDANAALREYYRVCRKNIIISVPDAATPEAFRKAGITYHHWIDRTHVNFFTTESLRHIITSNGFQLTLLKPIIPAIPAYPALIGLGLPEWLADKLARAIRRLSRTQYNLSLLAVATKV